MVYSLFGAAGFVSVVGLVLAVSVDTKPTEKSTQLELRRKNAVREKKWKWNRKENNGGSITWVCHPLQHKFSITNTPPLTPNCSIVTKTIRKGKKNV